MDQINLRPTTLAQLSEYTRGQIVELPPFAEGQPFIARLCRPSMLSLVRAGKIPNELLKTANELFLEGKPDSEENPKVLGDVFSVFDAICEACFLEPTYAEIQESGITLTDDQYMFIFEYSQAGVKALKPFREQPKNSGAVRDVKNIHRKTK